MQRCVRRSFFAPLVAGSLALAACGLASGAAAQTCAIDPVSAKGESSRYLWLAKVKARANWRRKIRSIERLGAAYSDWGRASQSEENCEVVNARYTCVASAIPCK